MLHRWHEPHTCEHSVSHYTEQFVRHSTPHTNMTHTTIGSLHELGNMVHFVASSFKRTRVVHSPAVAQDLAWHPQLEFRIPHLETEGERDKNESEQVRSVRAIPCSVECVCPAAMQRLHALLRCCSPRRLDDLL